MPRISHSARYSTSIPSCSASAPPEMFLETDTVERMIIIKIPAISSMTSVPKTSWAKLSCPTPSSSKALMMIVVELIESMPPRKTESIMPQPRACPTRYPTASIPRTSVSAVTMAVVPTEASLCRLNSSPSENISTMMPISLQVSMDVLSATVKK